MEPDADPTGQSVGTRLIIDGKYEFSDLDELIVNHVQAMARRVEELMAFEKFKAGPEDELRKCLYGLSVPISEPFTSLQISSSRTSLPPTHRRVHTDLLSTGSDQDTSVFASWPTRTLLFRHGYVVHRFSAVAPILITISACTSCSRSILSLRHTRDWCPGALQRVQGPPHPRIQKCR